MKGRRRFRSGRAACAVLFSKVHWVPEREWSEGAHAAGASCSMGSLPQHFFSECRRRPLMRLRKRSLRIPGRRRPSFGRRFGITRRSLTSTSSSVKRSGTSNRAAGGDGEGGLERGASHGPQDDDRGSGRTADHERQAVEMRGAGSSSSISRSPCAFCRCWRRGNRFRESTCEE